MAHESSNINVACSLISSILTMTSMTSLTIHNLVLSKPEWNHPITSPLQLVTHPDTLGIRQGTLDHIRTRPDIRRIITIRTIQALL